MGATAVDINLVALIDTAVCSNEDACNTSVTITSSCMQCRITVLQGHSITIVCHCHTHSLTHARARTRAHTHARPFNGHLSGTTLVSRYQKGKTNLILLKQETESGSGISWAISGMHLAPDRQPCQHPTTQFFYSLDALPAAQPTSKH